MISTKEKGFDSNLLIFSKYLFTPDNADSAA
jgi:hypothetical protein